VKYRIDYCPTIDRHRGRWSHGSVTVTGEEAAAKEVRAHEQDYGPELCFRATPVETMPEEEQHHFCDSCGGDFRERIGHPHACSCPVALAVPGSVRWVRPVAKEKAS